VKVEKAMQQLQHTGVVPVNDIIAGPKEEVYITPKLSGVEHITPQL